MCTVHGIKTKVKSLKVCHKTHGQSLLVLLKSLKNAGN